MSDIWELKEERKKQILLLKEKPIAIKKSILFASHYSYLGKTGNQILLLISTFILGLIIAGFLGILGFFLPYIIWIGYDIYRMEELINKYNGPVKKRINEIDQLIEGHMQVKEAIGHTVKFLERFNKRTA